MMAQLIMGYLFMLFVALSFIALVLSVSAGLLGVYRSGNSNLAGVYANASVEVSALAR